jgi:hypothetical protein
MSTSCSGRFCKVRPTPSLQPLRTASCRITSTCWSKRGPRYIVENPVRAGLVARVEDYPFLGSTVYSIAEILEAVQLMPASRKSG